MTTNRKQGESSWETELDKILPAKDEPFKNYHFVDVIKLVRTLLIKERTSIEAQRNKEVEYNYKLGYKKAIGQCLEVVEKHHKTTTYEDFDALTFHTTLKEVSEELNKLKE